MFPSTLTVVSPVLKKGSVMWTVQSKRTCRIGFFAKTTVGQVLEWVCITNFSMRSDVAKCFHHMHSRDQLFERGCCTNNRQQRQLERILPLSFWQEGFEKVVIPTVRSKRRSNCCHHIHPPMVVPTISRISASCSVVDLRPFDIWHELSSRSSRLPDGYHTLCDRLSHPGHVV